MNNLIKDVNSKLKSIYSFVVRDSKVFLLFKITVALSTFTIIVFIFLMRRNKRLMLRYCENIGYLRLLKPDVYKYPTLLKSKNVNKDVLQKIIKKYYSIPNGITNFGNNCYINVLMQVKILLFSV